MGGSFHILYYIKSLQCALEISYNFIWQLDLNKAVKEGRRDGGKEEEKEKERKEGGWQGGGKGEKEARQKPPSPSLKKGPFPMQWW